MNWYTRPFWWEKLSSSHALVELRFWLLFYPQSYIYIMRCFCPSADSKLLASTSWDSHLVYQTASFRLSIDIERSEDMKLTPGTENPVWREGWILQDVTILKERLFSSSLLRDSLNKFHHFTRKQRSSEYHIFLINPRKHLFLVLILTVSKKEAPSVALPQ